MELSARLQHELTQLGGAALVHALRHACDALGKAAAATPDTSADGVSTEWQRVEQFAVEAYKRSWEKLHCGAWKSITSAWREAFAHAGVLRCLMMAGPYALSQTHELIAQVEAQLLESYSAKPTSDPAQVHGDETNGYLQHQERPAKRAKTTESVVGEHEQDLRFPIRRLQFPSLQDFRQHALLQNEPVIITGAMEHWPALGRADPSRAWRDLSYFRRVAGWRTVPIEIGSSYLEDDWKQELMTVNEFIDRYIELSDVPGNRGDDHDRGVGYLAQHHLFEQIPVLGRDIMTPDYCVLRRSEEDEDEEDIAINAWFGPQGTVSPLHFDPKDNLLCQAVGAKYLRLYAPTESEKLYPVEGLLSNTSQVQMDDPDFDQFPKFRDAKYTECVLKEGEMLFIPPRYWHFVKSLNTSFSVSFWWS